MTDIWERLWHHLEASAGMLLQFAVLPIAKVLVLCGLGLILATSCINILPPPSRRVLSKLVFALFLPCLIFTQLGKAVSLENILLWWFIPANVVIGAALGCTLGFVVALILQPPPQYFNFTVVMIGIGSNSGQTWCQANEDSSSFIGNIGNMPLVIIGAVCRDETNPFGLDPETCNTKGVAYISFGQWVGAVIVYTFVYRMLAPPAALTEEVNSIDNGEPVAVKVEAADGSSETLPLITNDSDDSHIVPFLSPQRTSALPKGIEQLQGWLARTTIFKNVFQPPVVASLLAMLVGATPFLRNLIVEDHSFFFFLFDSLNLLGGAMVPCIMLTLGGNLAGGPGSSQLGTRTTMVITLTRLFLVPPMGLLVVTTADKFGYLPPNDKLFRFVLLLQHTMPTSILAGAVANLRGHAEKEASAILFWEHILAVFSMAIWLILYINVLF